jgi:hypothetical protein
MSSTNVIVNPVDSVMESIKSMSFMDLVALQVFLATHVKSESKKVSKSTKVKDSSAPKKVPSPAFLAVNAFKKHLETTQPALFEGVTLMKRGAIVSSYRADHEDEYNTFKDDFVAKYDPSATPPPMEKPAKVKKAKTEAPVAVVEAPVVVAEAPVVAEAKVKKAKKEAPVVTEAAEKPAKVKKAKKEADVDKPTKTTKKSKAEPASEPATIPSKWVKIEEDGVTFFHNTVDNTVWDINDDMPTEQIGNYNLTTKSIEYIEL